MVKAGSNFVFQMHHAPTGEPTTDRSYIGLFFARPPGYCEGLSVRGAHSSRSLPSGSAKYIDLAGIHS